MGCDCGEEGVRETPHLYSLRLFKQRVAKTIKGYLQKACKNIIISYMLKRHHFIAIPTCAI